MTRKDGTPIQGAMVQWTLRPLGGGASSVGREVRTDEGGGFDVRVPLPPRRSTLFNRTTTLGLRIHAAGCRIRWLYLGAVPTDLGIFTLDDVVLESGCLVEGRVLRGDLSPARDADVLLVRVPDNEIAFDTTTDGRGRYVISRDVPPAPTTFWITASSMSGGSGHGALFVLERAGHLQLPDLVLEAPHVIEGRVRFPDGSSVAGAYIMATDDGEAPMLRNPWTGAEIYELEPTCISERDGRYRLIVVDRVAYTVEVRSYPECVRVPARAGDRNVDFDIDAHLLRIRVVDEHGSALPAARVVLRVWPADEADAVERDAEAGRWPGEGEGTRLTAVARPGGGWATLVPRGGLVWIHASLPWLETERGTETLREERFIRVPWDQNESEVEIRISGE